MGLRKRQQIDTSLIEDFWSWFASEADNLAGLLDAAKSEELAEILDPRVARLHRDLAWEVGPGKKSPYSLTITSAGNRSLRADTDRIVTVAPDLPGWEFYPTRQPGEMPKEVKLHDRDTTVPTQHWKFSPKDDLDSGKIDIIIADEHLVMTDKNSAFAAVFIVLDALLGEDTVEEWIGKITFVPPGAEYSRLYPIQELPHYISWATTNPEGPLSTVSR